MNHVFKGFLEIVVIVGVISVAASNFFVDPEPLARPANRPSTITTPRSPVASIYGVHLGDDRASIEGKLSTKPIYGDIRMGDGGCFRCYGKVSVTYDKQEKAVFVSGDRLEVDGIVKLSGKFDPSRVEAILGKPDLQGISGVAMCEGAYPGYHYNALNVTTDFSILGGDQIHLDAREHFLNFGKKPDAAALKQSIDFRRDALH